MKEKKRDAPVYFRHPRSQGWYVAYNPRLINRGKNKGLIEVWRGGRRYIVREIKPI